MLCPTEETDFCKGKTFSCCLFLEPCKLKSCSPAKRDAWAACRRSPQLGGYMLCLTKEWNILNHWFYLKDHYQQCVHENSLTEPGPTLLYPGICFPKQYSGTCLKMFKSWTNVYDIFLLILQTSSYFHLRGLCKAVVVMLFVTPRDFSSMSFKPCFEPI